MIAISALQHLPRAAAQGAATEAQVQQARARGRDAITLIDRQDYLGAERALTEALTLHQAPTLLWMRGQAREHLGRLLGAMTDYQAAAQFPEAADEHPKYALARRDALARLSQLPDMIPRLTLSARGKLVRVTVNGVSWPVHSLPTSRSLDPGAYTVEALDAEGHTRSHHVELPLRAHQSLTLEGSSISVAAVGTTFSPSEGATPPARVDPSKPSATGRYALGAVTLALSAGAIITGIVALQKRDDYHDQNRDDVDMQEKLSMRSAASTWGWVSTALSGAAIAGAGTFVYLTFMPPSEQSSAGMQLTATGSF